MRHKCHYCLAFLSCLIVATVAAVIQTTLDHAPLILLRTAEGEAGEIDISIEPEFKGTYLNYIQIQSVLETTDRITPRINFDNSMARCIGCQEEYEVDLVFINSDQEEEIEIGREYDYDPAQPRKCIIMDKLAKSLGISVGEHFTVEINDDWFSDVFVNYKQKYNDPVNYSTFRIVFDFEVQEIIDSIEGKFPDMDASGTIIAEISSLFPMYANFVKDQRYPGASNFVSYLEQNNADQFSKLILGSLPKPRTESYMNSDYDKIQEEVTSYASDIVEELGFYPISIELPVLEQLRPLRFVQIFLGLLLNLILFVLSMLSTILIYTLLMMSIETRTFQLGVLRVLGLTKVSMVLMIFTQTLLFVIPAIFCGIIVAFGANIYISGQFESSIGVGFDPFPTQGAIGLTILVGLLIPLLSSLHPVIIV